MRDTLPALFADGSVPPSAITLRLRDGEDRARYGDLPLDVLVGPRIDAGLPAQRRACLAGRPEGSWNSFLDDDIRRLAFLDAGRTLNDLFAHAFLMAEHAGVKLWGLNTSSKEWRLRASTSRAPGLVNGYCFVVIQGAQPVPLPHSDARCRGGHREIAALLRGSRHPAPELGLRPGSRAHQRGRLAGPVHQSGASGHARRGGPVALRRIPSAARSQARRAEGLRVSARRYARRRATRTTPARTATRAKRKWTRATSGRGGLSLSCARPASEAARNDSGDDGDDAHAPPLRSSPPRAQRARLVDGALQRRACTARGSSRGRKPSRTTSPTSTRRYRRRSTSARAAGSDRRRTP